MPFSAGRAGVGCVAGDSVYRPSRAPVKPDHPGEDRPAAPGPGRRFVAGSRGRRAGLAEPRLAFPSPSSDEVSAAGSG